MCQFSFGFYCNLNVAKILCFSFLLKNCTSIYKTLVVKSLNENYNLLSDDFVFPNYPTHNSKEIFTHVEKIKIRFIFRQ